MNFSKVVGTLEEHKSNGSGRIKVVAYKTNGKYVTDNIVDFFPPDGYVFAYKFFERFEQNIHDLIEFQINQDIESRGDNLLMDIAKGCRPFGTPVINIEDKILENEFSINQIILKEYVSIISSSFYISNIGYVYGPFKSQNGDIVPKESTEVYRYSYNDVDLCYSGDKVYLLKRPEIKGYPVDCMTPLQLVNWFKSKVKNQQLNLDFNLIKVALEEKQNVELDDARTSRLLGNLEDIQLEYDSFKKLTDNSDKFEKFYKGELSRITTKLKEEVMGDLLVEKERIQNQVSKIMRELDGLRSLKSLSNEELELMKSEVEYIKTNKERLLSDIRVFSQITSDSKQILPKNSFYEQIFSGGEMSANSLSEFSQRLVGQNGEDISNVVSHFNRVLHQFKVTNTFLCEEIAPVLEIARISNNCKVIIQQVEADWLKFSSFYENVLEHALVSAHNNPDLIHFLILEDFNLSSIECYGRPFLDVLKGIRFTFPIRNLSYPRNLWVFCIPVEVSENFGLPLVKKTHNNWGAIPCMDAGKNQVRCDSELFLSVDALYNHELEFVLMSVENFFNYD